MGMEMGVKRWASGYEEVERVEGGDELGMTNGMWVNEYIKKKMKT